MSQGCIKYGTKEVVRQIKDTIKPEVLTQITVGMFIFNEKHQAEDIQKIVAKNIKANVIGETVVSISKEKYLEKKGPIGAKDVEKKNEDIREGINKRTEFYNYGNEEQGNLGEFFAERVAIEALGYMPVDFDKRKHGIDGIYIDKEGSFVVIEMKSTTDKNGKDSLAGSLNSDNKPRELSNRWVENRLFKMMTASEKGPDGELYSEKNCKVVKEITKAMEEKTLRRVLIHIHSQTLNVIVSECDDKENVIPFVGYEYIKK